MAAENSDNSITKPLLESIKVESSFTGSPIGSEQDGTKKRPDTDSSKGSETLVEKSSAMPTYVFGSGTRVVESPTMPSHVFGSEQDGTRKRPDTYRSKGSETLVGESSTMPSHVFGRKRLAADSSKGSATARSRSSMRIPTRNSAHHRAGFRMTAGMAAGTWAPSYKTQRTGSVTIIMETKWKGKCVPLATGIKIHSL